MTLLEELEALLAQGRESLAYLKANMPTGAPDCELPTECIAAMQGANTNTVKEREILENNIMNQIQSHNTISTTGIHPSSCTSDNYSSQFGRKTLRKRRRSVEDIERLKLPDDLIIPDNAYFRVHMPGYVQIGFRIPGSRKYHWTRLHRYIWEHYIGPIPAGNVVHHINGDPLDNTLENLAIMSLSDHSRMHRLNPDVVSPSGSIHYAANREAINYWDKAKYARKKGLPIPPKPWLSQDEKTNDSYEDELQPHSDLDIVQRKSDSMETDGSEKQI